jgi:hypothetical protein
LETNQKVINLLRSLGRPLTITELRVLFATTVTPEELQSSIQQLNKENIITIEQQTFKTDIIDVTSTSNNGWTETRDFQTITVIKLK